MGSSPPPDLLRHLAMEVPEPLDYSLARGLANSGVTHVISVEFRGAALRQFATLVTAFQMNSMLVSVRPNVTITMPEIISEATTSSAV